MSRVGPTIGVFINYLDFAVFYLTYFACLILILHDSLCLWLLCFSLLCFLVVLLYSRLLPLHWPTWRRELNQVCHTWAGLTNELPELTSGCCWRKKTMSNCCCASWPPMTLKPEGGHTSVSVVEYVCSEWLSAHACFPLPLWPALDRTMGWVTLTLGDNRQRGTTAK